ncbi:hypothetical protein ACLOJK_023140 [Asimina triloba]
MRLAEIQTQAAAASSELYKSPPTPISFPPISLFFPLVLLEEEDSNKRVVHALYDALSSGDVETVQRLLTPDLEWWFHGPPSFQHLMRLLTGEAAASEPFVFVPQTIAAFGSTVLVEGHDPKPNTDVFWVHAWTVADGVISQVREYFNTSLTVTRFDNTTAQIAQSSSSALRSLWESRLYTGTGKSMPGLVLAI